MRSIGRVAALVAVMGMPAIAYVLARVTASIWEGMDSASLADAGVALEGGLTIVAAAVGTAVAAYLALTGYAMLLGALWRGGRAIPKAIAALAPQGWTRVTATALGLSMSAGLAAPALAAEGGSTHVPSPGWVGAPVSVAAPVSVVTEAAPALLTVGWVHADASITPVSVSARADVAATSPVTVGWVTEANARQAPPQASGAYVVQPGDSLWRITEALLGDDASASKIAEAWPQIYEANHEAIGDNPSLIQPGLALTIPAGFGS